MLRPTLLDPPDRERSKTTKNLPEKKKENEPNTIFSFVKKPTKDDILCTNKDPQALRKYYLLLLKTTNEEALRVRLIAAIKELSSLRQNISHEETKTNIKKVVAAFNNAKPIRKEELPLALELIQRLNFKIKIDHLIRTNSLYEELTQIPLSRKLEATISRNTEQLGYAITKAADSHSLRRVAGAITIFLSSVALVGSITGLIVLSAGAALPLMGVLALATQKFIFMGALIASVAGISGGIHLTRKPKLHKCISADTLSALRALSTFTPAKPAAPITPTQAKDPIISTEARTKIMEAC